MIKSTLAMIKFFFISVPIFLIVYCTAMTIIEIKQFIRK